jgi:hypothetical protein
MRFGIATAVCTAVIFCLMASSCASETPTEVGDVQTPQSSSAPPTRSSGHLHEAPHGGSLVELGNHVASVEFVFESASGTVTAYVLDAHAQNPVRLTGGTLLVEIELDGNAEHIPLKLRGVANSLTGESETNTSQFRGAERALRGLTTFGGTIPSVAVRGNVFQEVSFRYP